MFGNLNWYNVVILLLLALFIFGDRLPKVIADGLRLLRRLRAMAQNATTDLSRELGTDISLEDLHPRTFVRKHVLSEEDQDTLLRPLKGVSDEVRQEATRLETDLKQVRSGVEGAAGGSRPRAAGQRAARGGGPAGPDGTGGLASTPPPATDPIATPPPRPAYDDIT